MNFYRSTAASFGTNWPLVLLLSALALTACPKEQANKGDSGELQVNQPPSRFKGTTAAFVKSLCTLKAYTYTISDAGVAVVYEELSFEEDGRFEAVTSIRLDEEPFSCRETGNWAMDNNVADDGSTAALTLEVTNTDCAGRSAPDSFRMRARISDQEIELSHI